MIFFNKEILSNYDDIFTVKIWLLKEISIEILQRGVFIYMDSIIFILAL